MPFEELPQKFVKRSFVTAKKYVKLLLIRTSKRALCTPARVPERLPAPRGYPFWRSSVALSAGLAADANGGGLGCARLRLRGSAGVRARGPLADAGGHWRRGSSGAGARCAGEPAMLFLGTEFELSRTLLVNCVLPHNKPGETSPRQVRRLTSFFLFSNMTL